MSSTSRAGSAQARALFDFILAECNAQQIALTTWCRGAGIPDPTVLRWREGVEPDMRSLRRVAVALDRSLIDILVAGGWITREEANGHVPQIRSYDLSEAIRLDTKISDAEREAHRQLQQAFAMVESGAKKRVRVTNTTRRR